MVDHMSPGPQIALLVLLVVELWATATCEIREVPAPPFSTLGYSIRMIVLLLLLYFGGFFQ